MVSWCFFCCDSKFWPKGLLFSCLNSFIWWTVRGFSLRFSSQKTLKRSKNPAQKGGCSRFSCSWRVGCHSGRVFKNQAIGCCKQISFTEHFVTQWIFCLWQISTQKTLPACKKYKVDCISAKYFLLPTRSRVAQVAGTGGEALGVYQVYCKKCECNDMVCCHIHLYIRFELNRKHSHLTSDEV